MIQLNLNKLNEVTHMKNPFEKLAIMSYFIGALITANEISQERIDHAAETAAECFEKFYYTPPIIEGRELDQAQEEFREYKNIEDSLTERGKQIHDAEMLKRGGV